MPSKSVWGATPAVINFKGNPPLGSLDKDTPSSTYVDAYVKEGWPRLKISASSLGHQAPRSSVYVDLRKCRVEVFDTDLLYDDAGDAAPRLKAYWEEVLDVALPRGGWYTVSIESIKLIWEAVLIIYS